MKKKIDLREIKNPWPKPTRSFNARLIPNRLKELALSGKYYDSKLLLP